MMRAEWSRACRIARTGGVLPATRANLIAAYRMVHDRVDWRTFADPLPER